MASQLSKIKSLLSELDSTNLRGTDALDAAIKSMSNFSSWQELINTMVKDCAAYDGHYVAFLKDQCGIVLDNEDLGAITGSDAGGSRIKTAESIVPESGDWVYPDSDSVTINGLTVNFPKKSTLSTAQQWIIGALNTWWISGGLDLINKSYSMNFAESGTSVKSIDVKFENSGSSSLLAYISYDRKQQTSQLYLTINMRKYREIDQTDPNGYSEDAPIYLDRTIAHELTHAVMAANIDYFYQLPAVFTEGVAEITHGIDDQRRSLIINLASSSSALASALATTATSGISTTNYAAGYMLMRYLAKQSSLERDPNVDVVYNPDVDDSTDSTVASAYFSTDQKTLTVVGDFLDNIWLGGTNTVTGAKDTTYANSETVTLDARRMTSNKILGGNAQNNVIRAGSGGATLWGGGFSSDTLYGGAGRDVFWYNRTDGNDYIKDFTAGTASDADVINFSGGSYGDITRSVSAVDFDLGNSTVHASVGSNVDDAVQYSFDGGNTVNAIKIGNTSRSNKFTFDSETTIYLGGSSNDTLVIDGGTRHDVWLNIDDSFVSIEHIDASEATGSNTLVGAFSDSVIIGGDGRSSMWGGGSSNDTLIGGDGAEMMFYLYGDGNDVMLDVEDDDVVNLLNVSLDQFSNIGLDGKTLAFGFNNGDTLKVTADDDDVTFQLADGSRWTFNHSSGSWR